MALFLSETDVRQILTMPMCLDAVAGAHRDLALSQAIDIPRQRTRLPQTALHILQGAVPQAGIIGYKAYTSNRSGNRFFVHLFSATVGELLAVIAADFLGMMRTGAASGVATRTLARPNARVAGVFGAGWQAEGHIRALCAAIPLEKIKVCARKADKLQDFCRRLETEVGVALLPTADAEATVRDSDIVSTVTTAKEPLFEADWIAEGTHINGAGSNALIRAELSEATIRRASLWVVDTINTACAESGDLLPLLEKGRINNRQLVELGDILIGRQNGRMNEQQITLFESQGLAIQDLAVAKAVLDAAQEQGLGQTLPF